MKLPHRLGIYESKSVEMFAFKYAINKRKKPKTRNTIRGKKLKMRKTIRRKKTHSHWS